VLVRVETVKMSECKAHKCKVPQLCPAPSERINEYLLDLLWDFDAEDSKLVVQFWEELVSRWEEWSEQHGYGRKLIEE
jgi:hypothetical protein